MMYKSLRCVHLLCLSPHNYIIYRYMRYVNEKNNNIKTKFKSEKRLKHPLDTLLGTLCFVLGWTLFFLHNCLNSSWHRFNKVLKTFLTDFDTY